MRNDTVARYRWLLFLTLALVLLHVVQLIPLPTAWWSAMPGRDVVTKVDEFIAAPQVWRPISLDPEGTWNALYALALPVAALVLAMQLNKPDHVRVVMVVALLIVLSGFVGVLQAAGSDWHAYAQTSGATGLFANRNHQAAMLAILFPMLAVAVATSQNIFHAGQYAKVTGWILGIVAVPLVLVTGSRAGLLLSMLSISTIVTARLYRASPARPSDSRLARWRIPWIGGGVAVMLAAVLAWVTIMQSRGVAVNRLESGNFELRWPVWQGAWDLSMKFWPMGSGLGSYEPVYQIYEPAELLRPTYSNHVHNDWLETLMTGGLGGLLLLLCAVGLFGVALARSRKGVGSMPLLRRLGVVMTLLFALASSVDYPLRVPFIACVFALGWVWSFVSWGEDAK